MVGHLRQLQGYAGRLSAAQRAPALVGRPHGGFAGREFRFLQRAKMCIRDSPHDDVIIRTDGEEATLEGVAAKHEGLKGKVRFMGRICLLYTSDVRSFSSFLTTKAAHLRL